MINGIYFSAWVKIGRGVSVAVAWIDPQFPDLGHLAPALIVLDAFPTRGDEDWSRGGCANPRNTRHRMR